jgi:arsenate reductase
MPRRGRTGTAGEGDYELVREEVMTSDESKQHVLFVCTHNSARSQMAEGLLRYSHGDRYDARSAGTEPGRVHPLTVRAMAEIGIDISGHASKSVDTFPDTEFDYVITVCDHAKETCPFFPGGKKHLHKSFPDPAAFRGSGKEGLEVFRRVRDEIKEWIEETFGRTQTHSAAVRGKERVQ